MQVEKTAISGLLIITPDVYRDERGSFLEVYQDKRYGDLGLSGFVLDNVSFSKKGVIRGLHYQIPPFAQGKLVQVLSGRVLDVALDIRFGSPTFGKHVAVELSAENHKQFWIPPGFAHGFVALEENTVFQYKCTGLYSKEHERGVRFDDPALGIDWREKNLIANDRDRTFPLLADIEKTFTYEG